MDALDLLDHPAHRRWWLLTKALECVPLDRALNLVGEAEQFLFAQVEGGKSPPIEASLPSPPPCEVLSEPAEKPVSSDTLDRPPSRLSLSASQNEEIRRRLAAGATNAELAAQFSISPRQAQGLRMGVARMAKRDHPEPLPRSVADHPQTTTFAVDEIIRYLRQQDDVVVPAGSGAFLVNSRFKLSLAELIERANRMRSRQNKPPFSLNIVEPPPVQVNGH